MQYLLGYWIKFQLPFNNIKWLSAYSRRWQVKWYFTPSRPIYTAVHCEGVTYSIEPLNICGPESCCACIQCCVKYVAFLLILVIVIINLIFVN